MDILLPKITTKSLFEMIKPLSDKLKSIKTDSKSHNELLKIVDSTGLQLLHMTCINEDLLKQFSIHLNNFKCEFSKPKKSWDPNSHSSLTLDLINSMFKIMEEKENIQIKRIIDALNNCLQQISNLIKQTSTTNFIESYKSFLENFEYTLDLIKIRAKDLISLKQKELIHLNISQIYKALPLIIEFHSIHITEHLQCKEIKNYLLQRFNWCFNELLKLIQEPKPTEIEELDFAQGHFIGKMDCAFYSLDNVIDLDANDVGNYINNNIKSIIEDVVCHALSIAQVALPDDQKAISEMCQVILNNLEVLKNEIWCIWVMSTNLSKSMETLEKLINTTLLKLVVEVFSNPFAKLKTLVHKCVLSQTGSDIDEEIIAYDLQMDQIIQIGLFALHCTNDLKLKLDIRSCLASLESLESELVPALTLFAKDTSKIKHRSHSDFFVTYWQKEIDTLILLVDQIIDPAAFTQVVLERTLQQTLFVKAQVINQQLPKDYIDHIILGSKRLLAVLTCIDNSPGKTNFPIKYSKIKSTSFTKMIHSTDNSNLITLIKDLRQSIKHCESTLETFVNEQQNEEIKRLYKCCKHLLSTIKHIEPILIDSNITNEDMAKTLKEISENRNNQEEKVHNCTYKVNKVNENLLTPYKQLANTLIKQRQKLCYDRKDINNDLLKSKIYSPFNRQTVKRKSANQLFGCRIQKCITKDQDELMQEKSFYFEFSEILSQVLSLPNSFSDYSTYDEDDEDNKDKELHKENEINNCKKDIENISLNNLFIDKSKINSIPTTNDENDHSIHHENNQNFQHNNNNNNNNNSELIQQSLKSNDNILETETTLPKQIRSIAIQTPFVLLNNEDVSTSILNVNHTAPPLFDLDLSRTSNSFSSPCHCTHLNSRNASNSNKLVKMQRLGRSTIQITSIDSSMDASITISSSSS